MFHLFFCFHFTKLSRLATLQRIDRPIRSMLLLLVFFIDKHINIYIFYSRIAVGVGLGLPGLDVIFFFTIF